MTILPIRTIFRKGIQKGPSNLFSEGSVEEAVENGIEKQNRNFEMPKSII